MKCYHLFNIPQKGNLAHNTVVRWFSPDFCLTAVFYWSNLAIMKKYIGLLLGVVLLASPILATAQVASSTPNYTPEQKAALIVQLQALVKILLQQIDVILTQQATIAAQQAQIHAQQIIQGQQINQITQNVAPPQSSSQVTSVVPEIPVGSTTTPVIIPVLSPEGISYNLPPSYTSFSYFSSHNYNIDVFGGFGINSHGVAYKPISLQASSNIPHARIVILRTDAYNGCSFMNSGNELSNSHKCAIDGNAGWQLSTVGPTFYRIQIWDAEELQKDTIYNVTINNIETLDPVTGATVLITEGFPKVISYTFTD